MFTLFIVLLSFISSIATKFLFWNEEPCMARPTLIDMNSLEFKYYPFIISLIVIFNVLPPKICVRK